MKKAITYCTLFLLLTSFFVKYENDFDLLVKNKLEEYIETNWPEKIYVQTDKLNYVSKDSIWFAAYLVNGITHLESTKSKVLYVELINSQDSIVDKRKLFINDLSTKGDFAIKKEWGNGKYLLRAYTNYMRNDSSDYFFQKELNIWSTDKLKASNGLENNQKITQSLNSDKAILNHQPNLNFYPEGGYLVENLASKVAFKIENSISDDTEIKGYITDSNTNFVTDLKIINFGMGSFYFRPLANKDYFANLEINGVNYIYPLPKALPKGYTLSTVIKSKNLLFNINSTIEKGLSGAYLMIHQRGNILYEKTISKNENGYSASISIKDFPEGVTHLTLFNANGNPVCERLVFIENKKSQGIVKINKNKDAFDIKEKITFTLKTENYNQSNLPSHLSLSVRHANTISDDLDLENIRTWLLLNSDLRGEIKNPNYYFSEPNDTKRQYLLDLVMLTNGWRRFSWQNLLYEDDIPNEFSIEKGIVISGDTKLLEKPYTLTPAYTSLTLLDNDISVLPVQKSSADGKFSFGPLVFYDSIPVFIQSRLNNFKSKDPKDRELRISIDDPVKSPAIPKRKRLPTLENETTKYLKMTEYIRDVNFKYNPNSQKLDEVVVIGNKKEKKKEIDIRKNEREQEMQEMSQFGRETYRMDIETDPTLRNLRIEDILTRFVGITFNGSSFSSRGGGNPKFIVDGAEVELDYILHTLFVLDISFIDYYIGPDAAMFSFSANGVVVIYTRRGKRGASHNTKRQPGIIDFNAKGFYSAKEFYSPSYSSEFEKSLKADVRTTLYWNPKVEITEQNPTKEISFFTGDLKGNYSIEIEGVSNNGIPLYQTSTFSVK